jgi:hypothetical protein
MLSQLDFKIFGLQTMKDQYVDDADFKDVFANSINGKPWANFTCKTGLCFALTSCVPASLVHLWLLQEAHGGGLMVDFGVYKAQRYWPPSSFGPRCAVMSSALLHVALLVRKLSHN